MTLAMAMQAQCRVAATGRSIISREMKHGMARVIQGTPATMPEGSIAADTRAVMAVVAVTAAVAVTVAAAAATTRVKSDR